MAFSGAAAVFISYTTAWCIRVTSSTTYRYVVLQERFTPDGRHFSAADLPSIRLLRSMVGALNKLPVAASGMIFFGDPVNFGSVSAVGSGFVAGLVYAIAKQNQSKV